jgi:hypothetical protein
MANFEEYLTSPLQERAAAAPGTGTPPLDVGMRCAEKMMDHARNALL